MFRLNQCKEFIDENRHHGHGIWISCFVAAIGYREFGLWGPAIVVALYVVGWIVNEATKGKTVTP